MAPFYGRGSTATYRATTRRHFFTTKLPEMAPTHFIDLGRMKG